ncbi:MAG: type I glutamate--ammonia ligase [Nitrospinota bacterium]
MNPKEVLALAKEHNCVMFDLKMVDLPGMWQHCSYPIVELSEELFEDGRGFDGSSIRGWRAIQSSDMLLIPDPSTAVIDPFAKYPTLSMVTNVVDPITREPYSRDPRYIAQKAAEYLKSTGIADTAFFGPEAEFFIFDDIRYESFEGGSFYAVDSVEAQWNTGRDENPNLGHKPRYKEGYFPVPPTDATADLRAEMTVTMEQLGIHIEAQHHEVATAGQAEIDMRFDELVKMADKLMLFKYVVKNVAYRNNKTATFMPKPIWNDNGSGMHVHQSLWKGGKPLFAGNMYGGLSQMGLYYIGGILKHSRALASLVAPTTNSYKRLVPGFEAPVNLAYSSRNRSASIRIPTYSASPKAKRIEVRFPDPSCNGYLAFAAMLLAGLDGIQNKIDPGEPLDKNIYGLPPEELAAVPSLPASLEEALEALKDDHQFLLQGEVFSEDLIEKWIDYKMESEVGELRKRPHPYEFTMYYDI